VHPFPSFLVATTAVAFGATARGVLSLTSAMSIFVMVLASQFAIGAFNDYCDAALDTSAKPKKPIPAGLVPRPAALAGAICFAAITLVVAVSFGPVTVLLAILATAAGLLYDFPLKRTPVSWLPYVLGLPLLPLWAWAAVGAAPRAARWAYPIGVLLALALHVANALPDDAGDRRAGTTGLVQTLGRRRSLLVLAGSFLTGAGLALLVMVGSSGVTAWQTVAGMLGALLGVAAVLVAVARSSSRAPFVLLAGGSAVLAVALASAVTE
jgi:4-hydroxybenzoate polyprenyltransferase